MGAIKTDLLQLMKTLLLTLMTLALAGSPVAQAGSTDITAHTFNWQVTHHGELKYLLYLPEGYEAQESKNWPLLMFLHGIGERGSDVNKVYAHGPIKLAHDGRSFPFLILAPQCPDGEFWDNPEALVQLLDNVTATHHVDTNRVYLTGLSMGGYGAWKLGTTYPDRFAAMIPICGGGELLNIRFPNRGQAEALKTMAVWAFHGAKDNVVPVSESQRSVDLLKSTGVKEAMLTVYPDAMHDAWTKTYANPEIYDWLLRHERSQSSKP